jgi:DnaJ-class molecular chaperone
MDRELNTGLQFDTFGMGDTHAENCTTPGPCTRGHGRRYVGRESFPALCSLCKGSGTTVAKQPS